MWDLVKGEGRGGEGRGERRLDGKRASCKGLGTGGDHVWVGYDT